MKKRKFFFFRKEKKKVICPFVVQGANKIFLYNIVIIYYYQRNIWKFGRTSHPPFPPAYTYMQMHVYTNYKNSKHVIFIACISSLVQIHQKSKHLIAQIIYTKYMQVYVKSIYSYIQLHVTVEMNTTSQLVVFIPLASFCLFD